MLNVCCTSASSSWPQLARCRTGGVPAGCGPTGASATTSSYGSGALPDDACRVQGFVQHSGVCAALQRFRSSCRRNPTALRSILRQVRPLTAAASGTQGICAGGCRTRAALALGSCSDGRHLLQTPCADAMAVAMIVVVGVAVAAERAVRAQQLPAAAEHRTVDVPWNVTSTGSSDIGAGAPRRSLYRP